eukprot:COSAG02_NODE_26961_length_620_cov_0.892514_1_plen_125_part_00
MGLCNMNGVVLHAQLWVVDAVGGLDNNKVVIVDVEVIDRRQPPRSRRHRDVGLGRKFPTNLSQSARILRCKDRANVLWSHWRIFLAKVEVVMLVHADHGRVCVPSVVTKEQLRESTSVQAISVF